VMTISIIPHTGSLDLPACRYAWAFLASTTHIYLYQVFV
jgi:hypothetical protein